MQIALCAGKLTADTSTTEDKVDLLIGLVGEMGAGKETFVRRLIEELWPVGVRHVHTGNFLRQTLAAWGLPVTRENLQNLVLAMKREFGEDVVTNAMKVTIYSSNGSVVVYDSVRLPSDLELVRSHPNHILVYVTADREVRWNRIRERKEKAGEEFITLDQFKIQETAGTEVLIPEFGAQTDVRIENNGTLRSFWDAIEDQCTNGALAERLNPQRYA